MSDIGDDLKATSAAIVVDAKRLQELEVKKSKLHEADPAVVDISVEAEKLIDRMSQHAAIETELAEQAAEA